MADVPQPASEHQTGNPKWLSIHDAVRKGDIEAIKHILKQDPEQVNDSGGGHWFPLNIAASHGSVSLVQLLLYSGANVNAKSKNGYTALMNAVDRSTWLPAEGTRHMEKCMHLGKCRNNNECRDMEEYFRHKEVAIKLLRHGANPNEACAGGWTPLHRAVEFTVYAVPLIQALLSHGAEPNACQNAGETPLLRAVCLNRLKAMEALLENRANPNKSSNSNRSPLSEAARHQRMQDLLRQYGAKT